MGLGAFCCAPIAVSAQSASTVSQTRSGARIETPRDTVEISTCGPGIVHVVAEPVRTTPALPATPWIVKSCEGSPSVFRHSATEAAVASGELQAHVTLDSGALSFTDSGGRALLSEIGDQGRSYDALAQPSGAYRVTELFSADADQAFYGLGQSQSGSFDYRGNAVLLSQANGVIAVPLLVSSRGYGILWNTAARSVFDNRFPPYAIFSTNAARAIDYYVLYGGALDAVVALYRQLTGDVPLFPQWAYGLFQSKNRYASQGELLGVVARYRRLHIPLDAIVLDYHWWPDGAMGDARFNANFPDVKAALRAIHAYHAHAVVSIWPNFERSSEDYAELSSRGFLVPGLTMYDATNPAARAFYWNVLPEKLLGDGFDGLWMDASEPEGSFASAHEWGLPEDASVSLGAGAFYANVYPLLHSMGVYDGWRRSTDLQRPFILTRSAFLGSQRYGSAVWSGDVFSDFRTLRRQIAGGLNIALSGIPYWTTDIGGYFGGDTRDERYRELFVRWFEFGAFCPIFRIHGQRENNQNELWSYGPQVQSIATNFDELRYRLLPYVYSLAWRVSNEGYTIMRPMVMDWPEDRRAWEISDQFMFGPALLVNPVTEQGANSRTVYLPAGRWYDFWSGAQAFGGRTLLSPAPITRIPIFVRAGSVLPLGPRIEYAGQESTKPTEIRIYRGASGAFQLYDDAGDGQAYASGARAIIPMTWNEASRTFTLGARIGSYAGMHARRKFALVWVRPDHGTGPEPERRPDRIVDYDGAPLRVRAPEGV